MVIYVVLVSFIINDFMDIQVRTFPFRIEYLQVFKIEFRGAKVNEEEKKRLNESAGKILREAGLDFEEWKDYDWIRNETYTDDFGNDVKDIGFADYYLVRSWNKSKMINEADATIYKRLVEIDTTLGTELSLQLTSCVALTTRLDIIKV